MKAPVELWVRLKVIDLVTQTAWITFTEKLDFADRLRGMVHYSYWGMEADGADAASVLGEIDRVIRADSAFTNQNKHLYRLMAVDAAGAAARESGGRAVVARAGAGGALAQRAGILSAGDLQLAEDFPALGGAAGGVAATGAPSGRARSGGAAVKGAELFAFDCLVREKRPDREIGYAERLGARLHGVTVSNVKFGEVWRLIVAAPSSEAALADVERMLVSRSRREGLLLNPHYQQYEIIATTRLGDSGSAGGTAPAKERP